MNRLILVAIIMLNSFSTAIAHADNLLFYTFEFKPFTSSDGSGPFKEIITEACTRLNHTCTIEVQPWARAQAIAENNPGISGLFVMGRNIERERWLNFSIPLVASEYGYFVSKDNDASFIDEHSLKGYHVATFGPSNTSTQLEKLTTSIDFSIIIEKSMDIAVKKISEGYFLNHSAVFGNKLVINDIIQSEGITNLKYFGTQQPVTYYIGFPKITHDRQFVDIFNQTLLSMQKEGIIKSILTKYGMDEATPKSETYSSIGMK